MVTIKQRVYTYFIKHYNFDPNHWIPKYVMEEIFIRQKFMVETGNRALRQLVEEGKLEERPLGKTIEYRLKVSYTPILSVLERPESYYGGIPKEVINYFEGV